MGIGHEQPGTATVLLRCRRNSAAKIERFIRAKCHTGQGPRRGLPQRHRAFMSIPFPTCGQLPTLATADPEFTERLFL